MSASTYAVLPLCANIIDSRPHRVRQLRQPVHGPPVGAAPPQDGRRPRDARIPRGRDRRTRRPMMRYRVFSLPYYGDTSVATA